jgi:hypothetical protein
MAPRAGYGVGWTPHNNGMHPTADTTIVKFIKEQRGG